MSPHKNDRALRKVLEDYLYLDQRAIERDVAGRPVLDSAGSGQQVFQAMLATCLMSNSRARHPFDSLPGVCLSGVCSYANAIVSRPDQLDVHTNTACRIASKLMPLLHGEGQVSGIPGLRLEDLNKRRLRFVHLPTGGRLDLIDSHASNGRTRRDFRQRFRGETRWHTDPEVKEILWTRTEISCEEAAFAAHWAARRCAPLRSALMTRAMVLWYKLGIRPAWNEPVPGRKWPQLTWQAKRDQTDASDLASILTRSPVRIPGADYEPHGASAGLLVLNDAAVLLKSSPFS
ncbi:hypothetical protein [Streptomyces caeruleatus]|uniref:hypothetical protein n=1 Tax=Streptomyces caeruleatus TaxID=661399 RepID=UPI000A69E01D|nr:hypothetical protein [Streptomyces caeruleatus]